MVETDILYAYVKKEDWLKKVARNLILKKAGSKRYTRRGRLSMKCIMRLERRGFQ